MNKRFIKKEFIFPIVIAIIAVIVVSAVLSVYIGNQYFYKNTIELAKLGVVDAVSVEKGTDADVRELIKPDTVIGSAVVGDTELPLVFSPDYADTKGSFYQLDNGILVSEIGNAVICCNKKNGDAVRALSVGDTVRINTFYGNYEYKVVSRQAFSGDPSEQTFAAGLGRSVTFCTAKKNDIGITSQYVAVNCKLASGTPIAE